MSPIHYVALSVILFVIGGVGVLVRRNAIVIFMCIELMLNACNLAFVAFAQEQLVHATHLLGAVETLRETLGTPRPGADQAEWQRCVDAARAALGERAFAAARAEGPAFLDPGILEPASVDAATIAALRFNPIIAS